MIYTQNTAKESEHEYGTKVFVYPNQDSRNYVYDWVLTNKINKPMSGNDYHVTVIYSDHPCPDAENHNIIVPFVGKIKGWKIFESPLGRCLVALIDSPYINELNSQLVAQYGATSKFPEFIAHMTVTWHYDKPEPPEMWPDELLIFDAYKISGIDPNWKPK